MSTPADEPLSLERVDYADGRTALVGWLARPAGPTPRAAVVLFPTIANANAAMERRARMMAERGFVTLIADFYGAPVADFAAAGAMGASLRADWSVYRARIAAAIDALGAIAPGLPMAAIGYCMGGQAALEAARMGRSLFAAVSFHGLLVTQAPAQPGSIAGTLLVCHGDADSLAPRDKVIGFWEEMDHAGAKWHFHGYSGVRHGFTDPGSDARGMDALGYDALADVQSWATMHALFDHLLIDT